MFSQVGTDNHFLQQSSDVYANYTHHHKVRGVEVPGELVGRSIVAARWFVAARKEALQQRQSQQLLLVVS